MFEALAQDLHKGEDLSTHLRVSPEQGAAVFERHRLGHGLVDDRRHDHAQEAPVENRQSRDIGRDFGLKKPPIGIDSLLVVDVQQTTAGSPK